LTEIEVEKPFCKETNYLLMALILKARNTLTLLNALKTFRVGIIF